MYAKKYKKMIYFQFILFTPFMSSKFKMVFFKGQTKVGQRPDWSSLRVSFKISDEQPRPFSHMGVSPGLPITPSISKKHTIFNQINCIIYCDAYFRLYKLL